MQTIFSHRSIRKFKPHKIEDEKLNLILEAATRASSSGNMQPYSIIVTRDPEIKKEMLKAHFDQEMILEADALVTFCADFHRMRLWLEQNGAELNFDNFFSFMVATFDATLAAQNAALMAESLGLGICFLGTTFASSPEIAKILNCPKHVIPVVGFVIGVPDEKPETRSRLPLNFVTHQEKYRDYGADEIKQGYLARENEFTERIEKDQSLKVRFKDSNCKKLADFYTKAKYTRESHEGYGKSITSYLNQFFFS
jgi:nitroreductase